MVPLACALALGWLGASPASYIRPIEKTIPAAGVTQVVLVNLVGPITVQTTAGSADDIHLTVLIHAGGADQTFARTLSQELDFPVTHSGGQVRIEGKYPLSMFRDYGYPNMKGILGIHGTDANVYDGQKVFIRHVGSKKAIELWAEIRLTLPVRMSLVVRNIYGDVELRGGAPRLGPPSAVGALDAFTDVGDFSLYRPGWANLKIQSDYGKVEFTDGWGAANDITLNTDIGGTYIDLPPGATGKIIAHKDLGFLHNNVTQASFHKDSDGNSVLQLGTGGPTVHIEMSVGSLHLKSLAG